jgi:hypothetical protein
MQNSPDIPAGGDATLFHLLLKSGIATLPALSHIECIVVPFLQKQVSVLYSLPSIIVLALQALLQAPLS